MPATTQIEVTMLFTRNGVPAQDIHTVTPGFPTVRIWDVTNGNNNVIIDNEAMNVVVDGPENDGFYKYIFTNTNGFIETNKYVCMFYAGTSVPTSEQYNSGQIIPDWGNEILDGQTSMNGKLDTIDSEVGVIDGKVDTIDSEIEVIDGKVDAIDGKVDTIDSEIEVINGKVDLLDNKMDVVGTTLDSVLEITNNLRKFESNRTKVDVATGELIVYDDDCTSILWKFRLLDENGQPNVQSIAERLPLSGGSGSWDTCGT